MLRDFFVLAFRNLRHRKRRSWLTIIGTLIGIMAVVSLVSIGQGLESSVERELLELGGNKLFISPGGGLSGRFSEETFGLDEGDLEAVEGVNQVDRAVGGISSDINAEYRNDAERVSVRGIPTGENRDIAREIYDIEVVSGRYLKSGDSSSLLVEEDAAQEMFDDDVILRSKLDINGSSYRVVGVVKTSQAVGNFDGLVLPKDEARDVLDKQEGLDTIVAEVKQGEDTSEAAEETRRSLRNHRGEDPGEETFEIQTAQDIIDSFKNQLSIIRAVLLGIGGISLLVGGVGIMNTMYTSVTEREREIGIMKSVGATRKQILGLFIVESGFIGLIGGILGVTLGLGISYLAGFVISSQLPLPYEPAVSIELIVGSLLFSFAVGTFSGALPAIKAARKDPVEALNPS